MSSLLTWLCVLLAAVSAASAGDPHLRKLVAALAQRVETLETGQKEDHEVISRLQESQRADRATVADLEAQLSSAGLGSAAAVRDGVRRMRQELRQLTDHIRQQATVGDSLIEMRSELDGMSQEIRVLKTAAESARPAAATTEDSTVIRWLKDMVNMLKGQVADLGESCNITGLLQLQQSEDSRYTVLAGDLRVLDQSVQTLRAHRRSDASQLNQLHTDLSQLLARQQDHGNTYSHLLQEVSTLRQEVLLAPPQNATTQPPPVPHHQRRHRRHHRHGGRFQLHALEQIVDVMYQRQQQLDTELAAARGNLSALRTAGERGRESLEVRLEAAEREQHQLGWQLNVTNSRDAVREVKTSTQQLLQEVDQLETKLDQQLQQLRAELARLDVSQDQLDSSVQQVRDEQKQLPALRKQVKQQLADLSVRQDVDRTSLLTVQSDLLSYALEQRAPPEHAQRTIPERV